MKLSGKIYQRKHRSEPSQQTTQQQYHDQQSQGHHYTTGRSSNYSDSQGILYQTIIIFVITIYYNKFLPSLLINT